ncbi:hypothetical protein HPP92_017455 [Vanilla planifolia]|uniref:Pentatricopeptide repeat-containing protein n=1 Tax=Vanilla planifolia TaxID=51239 RepID=A0A835UNG0_VANPL|nr:hypothetical protein HPP92_017455 [Vanilla planifolia]
MRWLSRFPPLLSRAVHGDHIRQFALNDETHLLSLLQQHPSRRPSLQIHAHLITSGLHRYRMSRSGMLLWNTLICRYSLECFPSDALHVYQYMLFFCAADLPTDSFTFSFLIKACGVSSLSTTGEQLHSLVLKNGHAFGVYVDTALVDMYSSFGALADARKVFDEMPERNLVSWNVMITGFTKWGEMESARLLFERMPNRNVISWTGLIEGYTQVKKPEEALSLFRRMAKDIQPSEITVLAVVPAISDLVALRKGETLHAYCIKEGLDSRDVRVENSLIDMYAKCGSVKNSLQVFDGMGKRTNLVSWNSVISGFASNGMAEKAVGFFQRMEREKITPNHVTFLNLLSACNHGGLVEEGIRLFASMVHTYHILPETKHYGCFIDMLGRAGKLEDAEEVIAGMPVVANAVVWRTLLGCCSKHGEVEIGEKAMRRIMELEEGQGGDYAILSNMLIEVGRFADAENARNLLSETNVAKIPGLSLT